MGYWSTFIGGTSILFAQCVVHSRRYVQPELRNIKLRTVHRKKRMGYDELDDMEFRKVKVNGSFDHSKEAYILPRANMQTIDDLSAGPSSGAYVITPFTLDNGNAILVNRGWVPKHKLDPETRQQGQVAGMIELVGLVRKTEVRPNLSDHGTKSVWHIRDVEGLAKALGTLPIFIDAELGSTVEGGPVGGQTRVTLRNDHLQYIVTWFSLSAATFYMWLKWFVKKM